jgi:hypothetical protein
VISFKETVEHRYAERQDTHQTRIVMVRFACVVEQAQTRNIRIGNLLSKEQTVRLIVVRQDEISHSKIRHHHHTEPGAGLGGIIIRGIEICKV